MKTAYDRSGMRGFGSFNNSARELGEQNLLEVGFY